MSKHICFFIGSISNGAGTERITISLANLFVKRGYRVSVVSLCQSDPPFFSVHREINTYCIFTKPCAFTLYFFQIVRRLYLYLKKERVDILINVDVILAIFSIPLKLFLSSIKIISWEHFNYKSNLGISRRDWGRKLSQKYANAIVTLTKQDRSFYLEKRYNRAIVYAIPNFLDSFPSRYANMNSKLVLAVGRYTYQKGFDILIEIWNEVKTYPIAKDWKLRIVGNGEDREKLIAQAKSLDLLSSIEFCTAQKDISNYYITSSIYVMTSRYEGLPMVLLEALSYGLPIVSYDCLTGPREIVSDNINGYIIPVDQKDFFIKKLIRLFESKDDRLDMQKKAIELSYQYSIDGAFNLWQELFYTLLNSK